MTAHKHTNKLVDETSPYLLQHAHNPVNWWAWNEETLAKAKNENKLILISIGYAACHWCHVMEHESFEDEEVAKIMNEHFINVKIDREERPDVDQVYMTAVQLMTGRGGWPLNCIALPDGRPLWGGTYFPKENWKNALEQLATLYRDKPEEAISYAEKLTAGVRSASIVKFDSNAKEFSIGDIDIAANEWRQFMDIDLGGRKGAPKFPMPNNYQFLLRYSIQKDNAEILDYVNRSLTNMAYGGIYDQIGGGFSRYSVDKKWHVPHFEKMLYDNGQLISLYAKAYQATSIKLYKNTVYETLDFIARELTSQEGAFYSSLDADSTNELGVLEEGAFYVWKKEELEQIIDKDFDLFSAYFNVNSYGFWEHDNYVLIRNKGEYALSDSFGLSVEELRAKVKLWKAILLKERSKKERPRLDDKVLTSWNALMLKGYIDAYSVFQESKFLDAALKNAAFIYGKQLQGNGRLFHNYKNGKSSINGFLEDYALVIDSFIALYEATFDEKWLLTAKQLADYTFDHFYDDKNTMFYFTSNQDTNLITRKYELEDNVISASNSVMARNLFKLGHYFSNSYYAKTSAHMLSKVKENALQYGSGYSNWLQLACDSAGAFFEIAISGPEAMSKLKEIQQEYIPNMLLAGSSQNSTIPLMEGRFNEDQTLIYVCVDGACKLPIDTVEKALLDVKIDFI